MTPFLDVQMHHIRSGVFGMIVGTELVFTGCKMEGHKTATLSMHHFLLAIEDPTSKGSTCADGNEVISNLLCGCKLR